MVDETSLEYKQRVLDTKSDSFCGAKWYNATIWLGSGMTTSCHHPLPHKVSVEEVRANPAALHNTPKKKQERIMMQRGEKPSGCEYCWKIEGISKEAISDRVYKSKIYSEGDLNDAFNDTTKKDVNLQTLEIAFDRTCQFACSYCNPAFSSTWVRDIKQNGPYQGLVSDGRNHFTHAHDGSQLFDHTVTNPYVEAFFKWWESDLQYSLKELRVTGGEPLMSGEVWKLLDWFVDSGSNIQFAINTNLGAKDDLITKFIGKAKQINNMHVYTSCEATGYMANYIRDGLDFSQWSVNMHRLAVEANLKGLHVMSTINALCLWSLVDFLNWCLAFKVEYGRDFPTFTLNILRFPSFQSPLVLPLELRLERAQVLEDWYEIHKGSSLLHQMELDHVRRLIDYLREVDSPHVGASSREQLAKDFKVFYAQYDQRRNKNRILDWPKQLRDWVDSI
jgi:organic radical activating enzyme